MILELFRLIYSALHVFHCELKKFRISSSESCCKSFKLTFNFSVSKLDCIIEISDASLYLTPQIDRKNKISINRSRVCKIFRIDG